MTNSELKSKLEKSVEFLQTELAKIRTGRASPALIESIKVNVYETMMELREIGTINVLDSHNLVVSPWDKGLLKDIAGAIRNSDLKLNPVVDGDVVRVPLPQLTEDRRKEMTKLVIEKVEEVKGSLRNARQDAMKDIEDLFKKKEIGEDEKFTQKAEVEEIVKEHTDKTIKIGSDKEADILKV
jgi:ribosome recycling factor